MRRVHLKGGREIILSDTVGFISDLPTQLVAAFRATLEEVTAADVILHVRDIANPDSDAQKQQVLKVLGELGMVDGEGENPSIPMVEVWNKWDLLTPDRARELDQVIAARSDEIIVPVSALTGQGCGDLLDAVDRLLTADAKLYSFVLPARDGQRIAWLHAHGEVVEETDGGEGDDGPRLQLEVRLSPREFGRFSRL
jgi:GTP-binding protein HflX